MESACRVCGHPADEGQRFCRGCGRELTPPPGQDPAPVVSLAARRANWPARIFGFLILLGLIGSINPPRHGYDRYRSRKKNCVSNMKTLEGASELYLMERKAPAGGNLAVSTLLTDGYLRIEPRCPSNGRYSIRLVPAKRRPGYTPPPGALDILVTCDIHAGVDDTTSGL